MMQVGSKFGMKSMKDAVYDLFNQGIITSETAKSLVATAGSEDSETAKPTVNSTATSGSTKFGGSF
jgi:hypothetical protein